MDWRSAAHLLVTGPARVRATGPSGPRPALAEGLGPDSRVPRRSAQSMVAPSGLCGRCARGAGRSCSVSRMRRGHSCPSSRGSPRNSTGLQVGTLQVGFVDSWTHRRPHAGGDSDDRGGGAQPRRSRLGRHPRFRLPGCAEPGPAPDAVPPGGLRRARRRLSRRRDGRDARAADAAWARRPRRASRSAAEAVRFHQTSASVRATTRGRSCGSTSRSSRR